MKYLFFIVSMVFGPVIYASCYNDYGCSYGQRCVKTNSYGTGLCVKIKDQYGLDSYKQNYDNYGKTGNGKVISGCMFNYDCTYGYTCYKQAGQMRGVCLK